MTLLQDLRAAIENCRACEQDATADLMERAVAEIVECHSLIDAMTDALVSEKEIMAVAIDLAKAERFNQ